MAQINPYIHFNGNAEEAFTFYQSVFGGEFAMIARFKDFSSPEFPVPEIILHILHYPLASTVCLWQAIHPKVWEDKMKMKTGAKFQ